MGGLSEHDAGYCHQEVDDTLYKVDLPSYRVASKLTEALQEIEDAAEGVDPEEVADDDEL